MFRTYDFNGYTARNFLLEETARGKRSGADVAAFIEKERARYSAESVESITRMIARQDAADDAVLYGRMFWLGDITASMTDEGRLRASQLWGEGSIDHPFGADPYVCAFTTPGPDGLTDGFTLKILPLAITTLNGVAARSVMCISRRYAPMNGRYESLDLSMIKVDSNGEDYGVVNMSDAAVAKGADPALFGAKCLGADDQLIIHLLFAVFEILNTDGVRQSVVETPPTKAQLRSGKPPLPPYIDVDASEYVTALREKRDYERSPAPGEPAYEVRPHRRRGHRRYLDAERTRWVWVRDCIIHPDRIDPQNPTAERLFYDASKLAS